MIILRLFLILTLVTIVVSLAIYFLTSDKRYLRFAWQVIKFGLVLLAAGALLFAIGRIVLF
jgi:hypothetical protein